MTNIPVSSTTQRIRFSRLRGLIFSRLCQALFMGLFASFFLSNVNGCEDLAFSEPWIREPPPVANVAAAYVVIENNGKVANSIDNVSADCCRHVMAHETIIKDGKARMKHLSTLHVGAGGTIRLQPLGPHLMLIKPAVMLQHGEEIKITFSCGPEDISEVIFPVIKQ